MLELGGSQLTSFRIAGKIAAGWLLVMSKEARIYMTTELYWMAAWIQSP